MNGNFTSITREERETHIYLTQDDYAEAYTNITKDMNKLERQGWELKKVEYFDDGTVFSKTFTAPRRAVSIRNAKATVKKLTDEEKQVIIERFAKSREDKNKG